MAGNVKLLKFPFFYRFLHEQEKWSFQGILILVRFTLQVHYKFFVLSLISHCSIFPAHYGSLYFMRQSLGIRKHWQFGTTSSLIPMGTDI